MPKQFEGRAVPITAQPNRGKGAGRKPKLLKKLIKENNVEKDDARNLLKNILCNHTLENLKALEGMAAVGQSVLAHSFITQAVHALEEKNFSVTRQMLDFIYGKDEQKIQIRDDGRLKDIKHLLMGRAQQSAEEKERLVEELERLAGDE